MRPRLPRRQLTLLAAILGAGLVFLDSTVINVVLPAIQDSFGVEFAAQQWIVAAYLLMLATSLLVGGALGDLLGRRRIFGYGLIVFGISSLVCAVAPTAGVLIVGRALQGLGGGLIVPNTLAVVLISFAEADQRSKAVGSWTAWTGIAAVLGPFLGGLLSDLLSWRWVFLANLPIVALIGALLVVAVAESRDQEAAPGIDASGALLAVLSLGGLIYALIEQPRQGWTHPGVLGPLLLGGASLIGLILVERRSRHPILPADLFANRNFVVGNLASLLLFAGMAGSFFFIVLFVQQVQGYSALQAGLSLLPVTGVMFLLAARFAALASRIGGRLLVIIGPLVSSVGLLLLLRLELQAAYLTTLLPALLVLGLGVTLTSAPLTLIVLNAVDPRHAGVATGINSAVSRIAAVVAIAVLGAVVSARYGDQLDQQLDQRVLSPAAQAVVDEAKARPLRQVSLDSVPLAEQALLRDAVSAASLSSFRVGMVVGSIATLLSALIAAVGLRTPGALAFKPHLHIPHYALPAMLGSFRHHHAPPPQPALPTLNTAEP